jgi:predicted nucleic acid-binding protein
MSLRRVVVDSDILLDHLQGTASPSVLRRLMGLFFCYTTVFQAAEVLARARTEREVQATHDAMGAMKILGVNARGASRYAELLRSARARNRWQMLIAGLCLESGLPLATGRAREYRNFPGLLVLPARLITVGAAAEEILEAARSRVQRRAARAD